MYSLLNRFSRLASNTCGLTDVSLKTFSNKTSSHYQRDDGFYRHVDVALDKTLYAYGLKHDAPRQ